MWRGGGTVWWRCWKRLNAKVDAWQAGRVLRPAMLTTRHKRDLFFFFLFSSCWCRCPLPLPLQKVFLKDVNSWQCRCAAVLKFATFLQISERCVEASTVPAGLGKTVQKEVSCIKGGKCVQGGSAQVAVRSKVAVYVWTTHSLGG